MGKISISKSHDDRGNKFWSLGQLDSTKYGDCIELECTYCEDVIVDFYINRMLVTQEDLIVEFADLYDNEQTLQDIRDNEATEAARETFWKEHMGEL